MAKRSRKILWCVVFRLWDARVDSIIVEASTMGQALTKASSSLYKTYQWRYEIVRADWRGNTNG